MSNDLIRMGGIVGVVLIVAITALSIFHSGDNTSTITAMISAALALLSFLSSRTNAAKIEDNTAKTEVVHKIVNAQRTVMENKIDDLGSIVADLRTEQAVTAAVQQQKDEDQS